MSISTISRSFLSIILLALFNLSAFSQDAPIYSTRQFALNESDQELEKKLKLSENERVAFLIEDIEIWDVDDNDTTHVRFNQRVKLAFVGPKPKIKNGMYKGYVFVKPDLGPIKIWEQTYVNDELDGPWKTFNLEGKLVQLQMIKNEVAYLVRQYQVDGERIIDELEYGPENTLIQRFFYDNGQVRQFIPYVNGVTNGKGGRYYEDGTLMETVNLKAGKFHGLYIYYHTNGQKWVEVEFKEGKQWNMIGNYTATGEKRAAGTLKNGNGTVIYYNEDDSVREVQTFEAGVRVK